MRPVRFRLGKWRFVITLRSCGSSFHWYLQDMPSHPFPDHLVPVHIHKGHFVIAHAYIAPPLLLKIAAIHFSPVRTYTFLTHLIWTWHTARINFACSCGPVACVEVPFLNSAPPEGVTVFDLFSKSFQCKHCKDNAQLHWRASISPHWVSSLEFMRNNNKKV